MNYLIAVVSDRIKAEEAYTALEQAGIERSQISILGKGYKTAEEFGLVDPTQQAKKRAMYMAYWLVPFGFAGGYLFNLITGLDNLDWAGDPGNHIVGGMLGAFGGAMGSVVVGGGVGLNLFNFGGDDELSYPNLLDEGKYLVAVKGSEDSRVRATPILRWFKPESLQGYEG